MSTVKQTRTIARELPTSGAAPPRFAANHKLVLAQVVAALVEDGLLSAEDGDRVLLDARSGQGRLDLHPLVVIANLKPKDARDASKTLTLESLHEKGRLVGVITHVQELAERLPMQVRVEKGQGASRILT